MEYLTLDDLAKRWGKTRNAVALDKTRGKLPEPDQVISRVPMWTPETIEEYERDNEQN